MPNFLLSFSGFFLVYKCINKFEQEIQIQCNYSNLLAASLQEKLLGKHFQKVY